MVDFEQSSASESTVIRLPRIIKIGNQSQNQHNNFDSESSRVGTFLECKGSFCFSEEAPFGGAVPTQKGSLENVAPVYGIQNQLTRDLGVSIPRYGSTPGSLTQFRGLGVSADEVEIQTLGFSLNPIQGGGFDLSSFPGYLWSGYQFQFGARTFSPEVNANSGVLELMPWTSSVLEKPKSFHGNSRAIAAISSLGVQETAVGTRIEDRFAVLAGWSQLSTRGPAGAMSASWGARSSKEGKYGGNAHLLVADLKSLSLGSEEFPTPDATIQNTRVIPVVNQSWFIRKDRSIHFNAAYDYANTHYENPDFGNPSQTRSHQLSFNFNANQGPWKLRSGVRVAKLNSSFLGSHFQNQGSFSISRKVDLGRGFDWTPRGSLRVVRDFGFLPEWGLGLQSRIDPKNRLFLETGFSYRVPSLLDRFSVSDQFQFRGNPSLQTERDWTATLGWEHRQKKFSILAQTYAQLRENARVVRNFTTVNYGEAWVASALLKGEVQFDPAWSFSQSLTVAQSRLLQTGGAFPYLSPLTSISTFSLRPLARRSLLQVVTSVRATGARGFSVDQNSLLSGYVVLDSSLEFAVTPQISLFARVENLAGRRVEEVKGYPSGRVGSLMLVGTL